MTMPVEQGPLSQPADAGAPVWQPQAAAVEPAAPIDDAVSAGDAPIAQKANAARRAPTRRTSSVTVLLVISAMVALGGVAFAVGRVTSTGQSGTGQTTNGGVNGPNGQNGLPGIGANASGNPNLAIGGRDGGFGGAATISGTVVAVTADSITVRLADGQTVTVATGSSTTYHAQTAATSSDVTQGATVTIKTTGGGSLGNPGSASASASPGTAGTRTATDVTITGK